MKTLKVKINGVAPILLHNSRLANALDPITKAIAKYTAKGKNKTESDYKKISELEFQGGLYYDEKGDIFIPDVNLERTIHEGSKMDRNGKKFLSGFMITENAYLKNGKIYNFNKIKDQDKHKFMVPVNIQRNKVIRTRPRFDIWNLEFTCMFNENILNFSEVETAIHKAGFLVGPKFGRFEVESIK